MPLTRAQMALANRAGNVVVVATVTTDAWELVRVGFSRLMGRDDPDRTRVTERRLKETRDRLTAPLSPHPDAWLAQLEALRWETRLGDLLEDYPGIEADLDALVHEIEKRIDRELPHSQPLRRQQFLLDHQAASRGLSPRERRTSRDLRPREPRPEVTPAGPQPLQGLGGDQPGD